MKHRFYFKLIVLIGFLPLLLGCWPKSISFIDSSMPEEWKTFSINTLDLSAPNAPIGYEVTLTESIKDKIQGSTRLTLNKEQGKGEILIEGKIVEFTSPTPMGIVGQDEASVNRIKVRVNFTLFINAPKEEKSEFTIERFVDFPSENDYSAEEARLIREINEQICQDIVNKLQANW